MSKTANLSNELDFVTLTIVDWIDVFTRQIYFDLIIDNLDFCQQKKHPEVYEYVVMTNHLHMICLGRDKALSDILRDFKTFTSKRLSDLFGVMIKRAEKSGCWRLFGSTEKTIR